MGLSSSKTSCPDSCACGNRKFTPVSAEIKRKVTPFVQSELVDMNIHKLQVLLSFIPKDENVLGIHYENGFNLLQKCVAENNIEAVKLILSRNPDLNCGPCTYPLHLACLKGHFECAELLLEHGARFDVNARMCWPGPHTQRCQGRKDEAKKVRRRTTRKQRSRAKNPGRKMCQNALYYAVDGDKFRMLNMLLEVQDRELHATAGQRPILEVACERHAWNCCITLMENRAEDIRLCTLRRDDEPCGNSIEMTLLHVLFFMVRKPVSFIRRTCELLLARGLKQDINTLDSMGNTPLQALIIRCAFEASRLSWRNSYLPWKEEEMKSLVVYLLKQGASESINEPGNGTLAHVIRHINDWKICYDLIDLLLRHGADPNVKGRDGNYPLMVCLTPLINNDPFRSFTPETKMYFMDCLEVLCSFGADPNSTTLSNLTPLHILVFTASENLSVTPDATKVANFFFIKNILATMFQFGLDPNVGLAEGTTNVFHGIVEMVKNSRSTLDLDAVYHLMLTLIQHGVNPNLQLRLPGLRTSHYGRENPFVVTETAHVLAFIIAVLAKKEQILNSPRRNYARVLYLLYFSMDHDELFRCLHSLFESACLILPDSPPQVLCDIITDMFCSPRTLKQITRATIHRLIDRRPIRNAKKLFVPLHLQRYLTSFDP